MNLYHRMPDDTGGTSHRSMSLQPGLTVFHLYEFYHWYNNQIFYCSHKTPPPKNYNLLYWIKCKERPKEHRIWIFMVHSKLWLLFERPGVKKYVDWGCL